MTTPSLQHELGMRRPFARPDLEAYLNLVRTSAALSLHKERLFKAHGLSEPSYNTLRIVRGHRDLAREAGERFQGVPCATILQQLVTPVPDLTRLVDRLIRDGHVVRHRSDEDRRVVLVNITPKGLRLVEKLEAPLTELNANLLGHLSERELRTLSRLLVKARQPSLQPASP